MQGKTTFSVREAAELLRVTDTRVRAMLVSGQLEGEKLGRVWAVSASSVRRRLRDGAHPGRPSTRQKGYTRAVPDVEDAHRVYDDARSVLAGCYTAELLDLARDADEQAFWITVADFFLQCRQRQLIERGVF